MGPASQERPRRLGRTVSLAMAAALAVFAFSPGSALAANLTVTQTANTDCAAGRFEWTFAVTLAPGETAGVEATFGSGPDYYFERFPTSSGATRGTFMFSGLATDALHWTLMNGSLEPVATGTATPNCAPAAPTSKSDCSGSGWTAFPAFKNRGQCTAFVERGGR
jgi:hypothetical protein